MANVLVVEDDADSLEVVARLVERAGHAPIRAANGWEALVPSTSGRSTSSSWTS